MPQAIELPGLDCGGCGYPTCLALSEAAQKDPLLFELCTMLPAGRSTPVITPSIAAPATNPLTVLQAVSSAARPRKPFHDILGRPVDFYMDVAPEDEGPREEICLRNPFLIEKLGIVEGDLLMGRPSGMSCGCPVTHVGVVEKVDLVSCAITWHITGPLSSRRGKPKIIGFYEALSYEGIVKETRPEYELKIGIRSFFLPRRCMMQWRHSGLITVLRNIADGVCEAHIEGLMIG
jgi:uncharacterized Fe-S cluster-containing protein